MSSEPIRRGATTAQLAMAKAIGDAVKAERARIMAEIERWPFKIEPDQPYTDGDTYEKGFYDGQAHAAARLAELIKRLTKP